MSLEKTGRPPPRLDKVQIPTDIGRHTQWHTLQVRAGVSTKGVPAKTMVDFLNQSMMNDHPTPCPYTQSRGVCIRKLLHSAEAKPIACPTARSALALLLLSHRVECRSVKCIRRSPSHCISKLEATNPRNKERNEDVIYAFGSTYLICSGKWTPSRS